MNDGQPQLTWHRSAGCVGGDCVEVANLPDGGVGVRNSHHPDGPVLSFTCGEWEQFLAGARNGEFNLPGTEG